MRFDLSRLEKQRWLCAIIIIVLTCIVYANSLGGAFHFDDELEIVEEERVHSLAKFREQLLTRRPVVTVSFALNHAVGGLNPIGFHFVNLVVHALAALTLFGLVRRTAARFASMQTIAARVACAAALLWAVHPLQTESVSYIVQRAESLMGLFYLLTFYCLVRGAESTRGVAWYVLAIVSCGLGMGSKAVMVTAPFLAVLFDRVYLSQSFGELIRRRGWVHGGLFATLGVLWAVGIFGAIFDETPRNTSVGFGYTGIEPMVYLQSQAGVILHYLRLSLIPVGQVFDYGWPPARGIADWLGQGIVVAGMIVAVALSFRRHAPLAFLGAFFFIVLAPTSSFVPIRDLAFEHRLYLPLAAVTVAVVLAAHRVASSMTSAGLRHGALLVLVVVASGALGGATVLRNRVYATKEALWRDNVAKRPDSIRAVLNLGQVLWAGGDIDEAIAVYREALLRHPSNHPMRERLIKFQLEKGDHEAVAAECRGMLHYHPTYRPALLTLGKAYLQIGKPDEAVTTLRRAILADALDPHAHYYIGCAFAAQDENEKAVGAFRLVLGMNASFPGANLNMGKALARLGKAEDALPFLKKGIAQSPNELSGRLLLGKLLFDLNRMKPAERAYKAALKKFPDSLQAMERLAEIYQRQGRTDDVIRVCRAIIARYPDHPCKAILDGLEQDKPGEQP